MNNLKFVVRCLFVVIDIARTPRRAAGAVLLLWLVIAGWYAVTHPFIHNSDNFGFIERAQTLSLAHPDTLSHGLYPLGYPLLLRGAYAVVGDYGRAGQWLSLVFGLIGLGAVYTASRSVLALLICATSPLYLQYATEGGTDMPAAALMMVSVSLALRGSARALTVAGVALGLAYLMRYTALAMYPAILLWLLLRDRRSCVRLAVVFTGGCLVSAAPQLLASTIVHGAPFYNTQVQNVAFGMYGGQNWGVHMAAARAATSLSALIAADPTAFALHWLQNVVAAWNMAIVPWPVVVLAVVGLALCYRSAEARLLALSIGAVVAVICLAFVIPRLLLFVVLIVAVSVPLLMARLPTALAAAGSLLLVGWLGVLFMDTVQRPVPLRDTQRAWIASQLAGIPASQVLALGFDYYDVSSPTKDRYGLTWYTDPRPYVSAQDVAGRMRARAQRYLVIDQRSAQIVPGFADVSDLEEAFTEVAAVGDARVFHILPVTALSSPRSESSPPPAPLPKSSRHDEARSP